STISGRESTDRNQPIAVTARQTATLQLREPSQQTKKWLVSPRRCAAAAFWSLIHNAAPLTLGRKLDPRLQVKLALGPRAVLLGLASHLFNLVWRELLDLHS